MPGYRYLFSQLVRHQLRRKYKGSTLGVLWYLVNPLVLMGAYTFMFGLVLHVQSISAFPIFVMAALVVWTFFQQSVVAAADSLIEQGALIRKARFPRETIPAAVVCVQLITLVALLVVVVPVSLAVRGTLGPDLLLLPVVIALLFCFVLGAALIVSVLHAYFRDVAPIVTAVLLPWFFVSPIFFRLGTLGPVRRHPVLGTLLDWVNPIAPFIELVRAILWGGGTLTWGRMLYAVVAAGIVLAAGLAVFRRMQGELAVVV
jgi:ABC-type polysaccharide/polyol phosphate export permease